MDLQDKILSAVLDIQTDVKDVKVRLGKVEMVQERVYGLEENCFEGGVSK